MIFLLFENCKFPTLAALSTKTTSSNSCKPPKAARCPTAPVLITSTISRVAFNEAGEVMQETHYYPFGLRLKGGAWQQSGASRNKYLYNGKELEGEDLGLNWFDYGARRYDPQLGKWHSVDPVDEFWSPFAYVGNNPIIRIDPDGSMSGPGDSFMGSAFELNLQIALNAIQKFGEHALDAWTFKPVREPVVDAATANLPDRVYIGINVAKTYGVGQSHGLQANWLLKGPDRSLMPYMVYTPELNAGIDGGFSMDFGFGYFNGDDANIVAKSMLGYSESISGSAFGLGAGLNFDVRKPGLLNNNNRIWTNFEISVDGGGYSGTAGAGYSTPVFPSQFQNNEDN